MTGAPSSLEAPIQMAQELPEKTFMTRRHIPGLAILVLLALLDLGSTLWWHSRGMMTEFNPLMRPLLEKSEWLFSGVKLLTLAALAAAVLSHARKNLSFCRRACALGAVAYASIWVMGVLTAKLT
jgi:hypothetical protein